MVEKLIHVGNHEDFFHIFLHVDFFHLIFHVSRNEKVSFGLFCKIENPVNGGAYYGDDNPNIDKAPNGVVKDVILAERGEKISRGKAHNKGHVD